MMDTAVTMTAVGASSYSRRRCLNVMLTLLGSLNLSKAFSGALIRPQSSNPIIASRHGTIAAFHDVSLIDIYAKRSSALFSTLPTDPVVMEDDEDQEDFSPFPDPPPDSWVETILSSYLGPRIILGVLAAVYATNFPLGALMNDNLPASAATSARMVVAAAALSPFVLQLKPDLRVPAVICGFFTAAGYVTQSLSLVDTDPARVSFLGSLTVLWCPVLEMLIDKKPMSLKDAPQTWLAAFLCIAGIGVLELYDPNATEALSLSISTGDVLAILQAIGFGTGVFWTSRMLKKEPHQALPVTATLLATTALLSMIWCLVDGWMFSGNDWQHFTLPGMLMDPSLRAVAGAVLWTGLISTSLNFFIELTALGRVPPSEASVLLASEPLWAALFAAVLYGTGLNVADSVGGALIVSACLVNAVLQPSSFEFLYNKEDE